ncbi:hypothetical protein ACU52_14145 [Xylanibacter rarus]|uniref:DNA pilot protein n=2 Tax=Xylanibacter rarus TaxID=1676614 RepID=A0A8E1QVJ6_9BACT|nr:hypothetical protein ACU52_14145 [Xylanibacter rarus]
MSLLGGLLGVGTSILGNVLGNKSQSDTNKTNLQIAQMNNEYNERMFNKQLDYNQDMFNQQIEYDWKKMQEQNTHNALMAEGAFNRQAKYNSAVEQRKRLEAAGLNPYLMMSGGNSGTASAVSGSSGTGGSPSAMGVNAPTASPAVMQAYRPDFSGATGVIQTLLDIQAQKGVREAQASSLGEQASGFKIENKYKAEKLLWEIYNSKADYNLKNSQEALNNMSFARMQAMFSSDVSKAQREADNAQFTGELIRAQTAWQQLQGLLGAKELKYYDQKVLQELAIMSAQQYSLVAAGKASEAQARQAIENALNLVEQREGIKVDNYVKQNTANALIKTARNNCNTSYWNSVGARNNSGPRDAWQRVNSELLNGNERYRFFKHAQNFLGIIGSWLPKL